MRHIIAFFIATILLLGCRDKVICPAFQSTYILDDSVRSIYYSYLWKIDRDERLKYLANQRPVDTTAVSDTTGSTVMTAGLADQGVDYYAYVEPHIVTPTETKRTKFGIVKYEPYWLKNYQLKTAPMENLLSPPEVEIDSAVDVGEFVASDFNDSLGVDSTAVALNLEQDTLSLASSDLENDSSFFELPKIAQAKPPEEKKVTEYLYNYNPKDKMLNVEQEYYNYYYGKYLVRERMVPINKAPAAPDSTLTFKDKLKNFFSFKWMFKGKNDLVAEGEESEGGFEGEETETDPEEEITPETEEGKTEDKEGGNDGTGNEGGTGNEEKKEGNGNGGNP